MDQPNFSRDQRIKSFRVARRRESSVGLTWQQVQRVMEFSTGGSGGGSADGAGAGRMTWVRGRVAGAVGKALVKLPSDMGWGTGAVCKGGAKEGCGIQRTRSRRPER
jgi:hypothetical protein